MKVQIRYTRRGRGVVESVAPEQVAARLETLCRQRIAAKAADMGGPFGASWRNDDGAWCWYCNPPEDAWRAPEVGRGD